MRLFGYPYNDLVICKDSPDYLTTLRNLANYLNMNMAEFQSPFTWNMKENSVQPN